MPPLSTHTHLFSVAVPLMAAVETEPVRPSEENLYGVASVAYIERAAGPQPEAYDLRSAEGVAAYWSALEDAALEMGAGKRGAPLSAAHLTAFPFDRAIEAATDRAWQRRRALLPQQQAALLAAVGEESLANVTTQRCRELAASMDLHIDAVMSFVRQRKARQRADRLQGLNGWQVAGLGAMRKGGWGMEGWDDSSSNACGSGCVTVNTLCALEYRSLSSSYNRPAGASGLPSASRVRTPQAARYESGAGRCLRGCPLTEMCRHVWS